MLLDHYVCIGCGHVRRYVTMPIRHFWKGIYIPFYTKNHKIWALYNPFVFCIFYGTIGRLLVMLRCRVFITTGMILSSEAQNAENQEDSHDSVNKYIVSVFLVDKIIETFIVRLACVNIYS